MIGRKRLGLILAAILFGLIINTLCPVSEVYADPPVIGYATQQMSTGGTQTLTASGGSGGPYTWAIIGGSGTLSNTIGDSITYTAPSSNPYCATNPSILLSDSSGQYAELQINVNAVSSHDYYSIAGKTGGTTLWSSGCFWHIIYYELDLTVYCNAYYCDGTPTYYGSCAIECNRQDTCPSCTYPDCSTVCVPQNFRGGDIAGCCPPNGPPPPAPSDTGCGSSCCNANSPDNPNVEVGSSANLKSGNLYDSLDIAGLTLSYNSTNQYGGLYSGPLGKKWTHSYNQILTNLGDGITESLRTGEGGIINFKWAGSGVYYPEARSGDTSQIVVNYGNSTYVRTDKNGVAHTFDPSGKLLSIKDRNNNTATLTYNGNNLARITDQNGRMTTITTTNNLITSITDPGGRVYTLAYTNSLLTSVTDPLGNAWHYTYDSSNRMLTKTDPAGKVTTYTYDTSGRLLTSTDPENKTRTMNYTQTGTTTHTEKDGGIWTYTYDPVYAVKTAMTDPLGNTTRHTYDARRNLIFTTDANGNITHYTYDANSNVTSVTDPLGNVTSYTYNSLNLVTSVTDPRNVVTTNTYDAAGNLLTIIVAGAVTTFQHDAKGNVTSITDALNRSTALAYDSQNNLTSITDPLGKITSFTYDTVGNRLSMTDPLGNVTSYTYNSLNQMTQVTDPRNNVTNYTYDYKGKVLSTTDGNGNPTSYAYNYRGQVTQITDALNGITRLTYDPSGCGSGCGGVGKLASLTDALNHITHYTYDLAGHLTTETDPLNDTINYTYDAKGNVLTKTKPDGHTITFTYDADNRLVQKQYSDGSITQYQYDPNGNMIYAGNQNIAYNFTYDAMNRVTGVVDSNNRTIQYQYDLLGNRTSMVTPENRTITYAYDANRRLTTLTANSGAFGLTYDNAGRRTALTYPNNTTASYTYDNNGNLTRIRHTNQNLVTLAEANYTYDQVNNRLTRTDPAQTATYGYDQIYRLVQGALTDNNIPPNPLPGGEVYTYDAVGNRLTGPNFGDTLIYDNANELLDLNATTYVYDLNGNRIQKIDGINTTTYTYDDENRLTGVEITGGINSVITYVYDPFGRRIRKNVDGVVTTYVYDKEAIILEYDQFGTVQARYTHGLGIDEPLAMEKNGQMSYYHGDGLGSILALTNADGYIVQTYVYDSFGNITSGLPTSQPFTYTAREYDPETGLYFYRARYYDPKAGRFLTTDPIGFAGGVNQYVYVGNNPINLLDPFGKTGQEIELAIKMALPLITGVIEIKSPSILQSMGYGGDLFEIISGGSGIFTAEIIANGSPSAPVLLPIGLSLLGGIEVGLALNRFYERLSGQPLGSDIYDWLHPRKEKNSKCR